MGEILKFKKRPPAPQPPPDTSGREGAKEFVGFVIQELFTSEMFRRAFHQMIAEHDEQRFMVNQARGDVVALVKRFAKLANMDTREVYTMLLNHFGYSQSDANYQQLLERKQLLERMVAEQKEKNKKGGKKK